MSSTWKPIKLLRDVYGTIIAVGPDSEIKVAPVEIEDRGRLLRAKLGEEVDEYLEDRTPEELVDIIEVCIALAHHLHNMDVDELVELGRRKRDEKGGFANCLGIFVQVTVKR